MRWRGIWSVVFVVVCVAHAGIADELPDKVGFNRHVRPILSNACFSCHGPDEKHREADLRLDTRLGATADLGGHAALVPGTPQVSTLLDRVTSAADDELMPPTDSKRPRLSPREIAILQRWIEQGAPYEGHWAFQPLARTDPPVVEALHGISAKHPIDRFIFARLATAGIAPSPEADRATLIRRLSLDLVGLLPTPEETAAFISDTSPLAYEHLVDRLLASPHYGERWGRHWLDQARYADSNGYTIDSPRQMWPYRDWVIHAVNQDMPFDRFTIEQLAGDLLDKPKKSQIVATAFHRNTLMNEEGGTDREQFRHEAVVDRVNTTAAVWLGLTVACAQCHTHKFDPISHREYYELFAFFNQGTDVNNKGATVSVTRGEMFGQPDAASSSSVLGVQASAKEQTAWERAEIARLTAKPLPPVAWSAATYLEYDTQTGAGFKLLDDNSLLSDGRGNDNDTYRVAFTSPLARIAAIRLRVLTHDSLPKRGPGLAANGNFVITSLRLSVDGKEQPLVDAFASHEQPNYPVSAAIDDNSKSGWAINVAPGSTARMNDNHEAVFILQKPLEIGEHVTEIRIFHELNENYLVGRFAIDVSAEVPSPPHIGDEALLAALRTSPARRSPAQAKLVQQRFHKTQSPPPPSLVVTADVMVMEDLEKPRETYLSMRGDFLQPDTKLGGLAPGGIAAVAPALPAAAGRTRLDLARWLVDPQHVLTPRVTVNRVWMRYFGRGLVETEDDFGTQGSPPTHPDLLDWLAGEFMARGWSMKRLHKLIVTSHTYKQSSRDRPELRDTDPRNVLLARQERVRVEGEIVRDTALSASGLLDPTIGGPSVFPPQPAGVYAFTQNAKRWVVDSAPARHRRALYTTFFRSAPYPLFTTFDAPDFQTACTRRGRSNTPLQALTVANDEAFIEIARGLAARVLRESPQGDAQARVQRAWLLCLCREPTRPELDVLLPYHERQQADFEDHPERTKAFLSHDWPVPAAHVSPAAAAALVAVSRAILNTDAFITRE